VHATVVTPLNQESHPTSACALFYLPLHHSWEWRLNNPILRDSTQLLCFSTLPDHSFSTGATVLAFLLPDEPTGFSNQKFWPTTIRSLDWFLSCKIL
jgi:hypothetical protein